MPWVEIKRDGIGCHPLVGQRLSEGLADVVVEALSVPGTEVAQLTTDDVEVFMDVAGLGSKCHPVNIMVTCNVYHERQLQLDNKDHQNRIAELLHALVNKDMPFDELVHGIIYFPQYNTFIEF